MERVLAAYTSTFLETNNLLSSKQFGFTKGFSMEDQLLLTYIVKKVDQEEIVDMVLLDFSKAFDVVYHEILLH